MQPPTCNRPQFSQWKCPDLASYPGSFSHMWKEETSLRTRLVQILFCDEAMNEKLGMEMRLSLLCGTILHIPSQHRDTPSSETPCHSFLGQCAAVRKQRQHQNQYQITHKVSTLVEHRLACSYALSISNL